MTLKNILFLVLFSSLIGFVIPREAAAETVTIEATETNRGKAPVVSQFTVDLNKDTHSEISWLGNAMEVRVRLELVADRKRGETLRFKISAERGERKLRLQGSSDATRKKRNVVGRAATKSGSLEVALTVNPD